MQESSKLPAGGMYIANPYSPLRGSRLHMIWVREHAEKRPTVYATYVSTELKESPEVYSGTLEDAVEEYGWSNVRETVCDFDSSALQSAFNPTEI